MTVEQDTEAEIVRLYYGEHWPTGTIAVQLGVHADVVRRILGHAPATGDASRSPGLLAPFTDFIEQTLRQYPTLRSTRVYDMVRERGYTGSPRTVRRYVRGVRPERKTEAFLRLETLAGEQAQIDWAHVGRLAVPGGDRVKSLFLCKCLTREHWAQVVHAAAA